MMIYLFFLCIRHVLLLISYFDQINNFFHQSIGEDHFHFSSSSFFLQSQQILNFTPFARCSLCLQNLFTSKPKVIILFFSATRIYFIRQLKKMTEFSFYIPLSQCYLSICFSMKGKRNNEFFSPCITLENFTWTNCYHGKYQTISSSWKHAVRLDLTYVQHLLRQASTPDVT